VEPAGVVLRDHAVVVAADSILAVAPHAEAAAAYPDAEVVDLRGHIVIPGLVNAHTHAAMTLLRGFADDLALLEWLQDRIWPTEQKAVTDAFVADGTTAACWEMLTGGTTSFADMYLFPGSAIAAAASAGVRINAGLAYLTVPTAYAATEQEYLSRGLEVHQQWRDHPLVSFSLAPHATYSTTPQSMTRIRALCDEHRLGVHTHLQETQEQVDGECREFGMTGVQRLLAVDALGPGFFGAHGVHLDDRDIEVLAHTGSSVVHCPSSNLKLASGFAPVARLLAAGVNVALGTDGAASNNRLDMWQEMRTAAVLAKAVAGDPAAVPAHSALRMATMGGAAALGLADRVGSLVPGKQADIVSVAVDSPASQPVYDPASHLVYVLGREAVRNVWVAGRHLVRDGYCTTVDGAAVSASARAWADRVRSL
jgi:5-methylthioadenosine/S-adenosylhomocysteine deaminase